MKNTELAKLRDKSADELTGMVKELREGMLKARIARSLEGKQAGMGYRVSRRQIARLETLLTQKRAGAPAPAAKASAPAAKAEKKAAPAASTAKADKPAKPAAAKKPSAKTEKKA